MTSRFDNRYYPACYHRKRTLKDKNKYLMEVKMAKDFAEQIDRSRNRVAKCLNLLEAVHEELEYVFEQNPDWNPEIKWQIEEAACKLGFSLATLSTWFDDEEEE